MDISYNDLEFLSGALREEVECRRAVREITESGDVLRYSMMRMPVPKDITDTCTFPVVTHDQLHPRLYRQYYSTAPLADFQAAFQRYRAEVMLRLPLPQRFSLRETVPMRVYVTYDGADPFEISFSAIRMTNVADFSYDYGIEPRENGKIDMKLCDNMSGSFVGTIDLLFTASM